MRRSQLHIMVLLICIAGLIIFSCKNASLEKNDTVDFEIDQSKPFGAYDYDNPASVFDLPKKLKEISGLTFDTRQNVMYCHNDEVGTIYTIDEKNGSIIDSWKALERGDYEGICHVGENLFIAKSNGTIYNLTSGEQYNTTLSKNNNIEGLCYDEKSKALLLAGKGFVLGRKGTNSKAIYKFDLQTKELSTEILITDDELLNQYKAQIGFDIADKISKQIKQFSPSGICIHPITKETYITSARGNMIVVLDVNRIVKLVSLLDKKLYPQIEGICFSNHGTLFLCSEGNKSKPGRIIKYEPLN